MATLIVFGVLALVGTFLYKVLSDNHTSEGTSDTSWMYDNELPY